jgi:hypothetical protein
MDHRRGGRHAGRPDGERSGRGESAAEDYRCPIASRHSSAHQTSSMLVDEFFSASSPPPARPVGPFLRRYDGPPPLHGPHRLPFGPPILGHPPAGLMPRYSSPANHHGYHPEYMQHMPPAEHWMAPGIAFPPPPPAEMGAPEPPRDAGMEAMEMAQKRLARMSSGRHSGGGQRRQPHAEHSGDPVAGPPSPQWHAMYLEEEEEGQLPGPGPPAAQVFQPALPLPPAPQQQQSSQEKAATAKAAVPAKQPTSIKSSSMVKGLQRRPG